MTNLTVTKQRCIDAIKKFSEKCDSIIANLKHDVDKIQKGAIKEIELQSTQKDQAKFKELERDLNK